MSRNPERSRVAPFVLATLLLGSLGAKAVLALPDDRLQAIEITAERAYRDEKAGFTVYSGQVILEQGSLHIEADKVTIFHDREAADRIIAIGKPARLRQQPEPDKGFVTASAGRIVYVKSRERITLLEAAVIEQDGAVVSGESIDYYMAEQRVLADAGAQGDDARVQVFIPAAVVEERSAEEGAEPAPQGVEEETPKPPAEKKNPEQPDRANAAGTRKQSPAPDTRAND